MKFPQPLRFLFLSIAALSIASTLPAQEQPQGPMEAPKDHHVTRINAEPEPPAPPSLPPEEIIRRFAQKEDLYLQSRPNYGFRKSVRLQEFAPDGSVAGEYYRVTDYTKLPDGRIAAKSVEKPQSTLQDVYLAPEDLDALDRVPAYPLTTSQLGKYDLKYLGKEQVDEIDCYIFQVKPKQVDRSKAYFDGVVWVDAQFLEVVKTYGRWITEQGAMKPLAQFPFALYETYRENVDGKYWFPNYLRSDETLQLKSGENIPVRLTVKWSNFKPAGAASAESPSSSGPAPAPANSSSPAPQPQPASNPPAPPTPQTL
jgi:hypothetical protein